MIESAVKQSLQAKIPQLHELVKIDNFIRGIDADLKFIAHCEGSEKRDLRSFDLVDQRICVLIGPEGDFTSKEIAAAVSAGFMPLTLGSNRLRTETAGLYVCQAVSLFTI